MRGSEWIPEYDGIINKSFAVFEILSPSLPKNRSSGWVSLVVGPLRADLIGVDVLREELRLPQGVDGKQMSQIILE